MQDIELPYVTIRYQEPIVYFYFKEGTQLGFPEIKELVKCAEKLSEGKTYVTFSDVRAEVNITEEGKKYVADPNNMKLFRGTAALVKNNLYKFAGNFMAHFNKQKYPFRAFADKAKAIAWLHSLPLD